MLIRGWLPRRPVAMDRVSSRTWSGGSSGVQRTKTKDHDIDADNHRLAVHVPSASQHLAIHASSSIQRSYSSPTNKRGRQPRIAISPESPALTLTLHRDVYTIRNHPSPSSSQRKGKGALQRNRKELRDTAKHHDDRNRKVDDPTTPSATMSASICIIN